MKAISNLEARLTEIASKEIAKTIEDYIKGWEGRHKNHRLEFYYGDGATGMGRVGFRVYRRHDNKLRWDVDGTQARISSYNTFTSFPWWHKLSGSIRPLDRFVDALSEFQIRVFNCSLEDHLPEVQYKTIGE